MEQSRLETTKRASLDRVLDAAMKIIPTGVIIAIGAFIGCTPTSLRIS